MSAAEVEGPSNRLPAPFDDIGFAWYASMSGIALEYRGNASRLVEAGAIEPDMAVKAKTKARPRSDSAGHYFHRDTRVARRPLREELIVWRLITDQRFAETLPGVPRGLRLKFFDWFDEHPGELHITTETKADGTRTCMVGNIENLLAAGFRRSAFERRFGVHGRHLGLSRDSTLRESDVDTAAIRFDSAYIRLLMQGYFDITMYSKNAVAPEAPRNRGTPKPERTKRGGSALRLVVDNTGEVRRGEI